MNSLKDIYVDQLQDIYSADFQSAFVSEKLAKAAKEEDLAKALESGVSGIKEGMQIMAEIIKKHGADPTGEHCNGMEGLVKEAKAHCLEQEFTSDEARDAMIITQYQRMAHYAIAGYGCLYAFAQRLGLEEEANKLKECLDNTVEGDKHMTSIAMKKVNSAAA